MKKDLRDYLHLYLGCNCKSSQGTMIYKLSSVDTQGKAMFYDGQGNHMWLGEDFKPILRPLSSITPENESKLNEIERNILVVPITGYTNDKLLIKYNSSIEAERTRYLLNEKFDLFGFIESGQAIDITTLN